MIRKTLEHLTLGSLDLVPTKVARHILFLLTSNRTLADKWGYHIRPVHYYDPLPDFREITPERIGRRRESLAIDFAKGDQKQLLTRLSDRYAVELADLASKVEPEGFDFGNSYFSNLDAALYYALVRELHPSRIVEIGAGYSTRIASKALARNRDDGHPGVLVCVEPYPEPRLTDAKLPIELIRSRVEDLELDFFSSLVSGDILFIDSSHVAKFGSDVCREFLEILPVLKPGVWVHVHDIFFPFDYPSEWLLDKRHAFNEQYLLEAFLAYNSTFAVKLSGHWLRHECADLVREIIPRKEAMTNEHGFSSFWMQKKG